MPMFKRNRFTFSFIILAVILFFLVGCSEMEQEPNEPEATPIEIPGPETEESSEDQDSPEATPIEIPAEESDTEEEQIQPSE